MAIRVLLVDDTRMFREGLRMVIKVEPDMTVVGVAGDGAEGLNLARQERPDVVLMDIRMPVMDGVEATRRLKAELPDTHVIMLTTFSDDEYIFDAIRAGAVGYLIKDMPVEDLISAIRAVYQGGALIPPAIAARLVAEYARVTGGGGALAPGSAPPTPALVDLTPRETEILKLVAEGRSNKEIAESLYLSEGTVRNYVSSIFSKLHARDRAQAVSFALRMGLLD